jgi:hypothetical protein
MFKLGVDCITAHRKVGQPVVDCILQITSLAILGVCKVFLDAVSLSLILAYAPEMFDGELDNDPWRVTRKLGQYMQAAS